jgi:hypothetical protein
MEITERVDAGTVSTGSVRVNGHNVNVRTEAHDAAPSASLFTVGYAQTVEQGNPDAVHIAPVEVRYSSSVAALGWTDEETRETYRRLRSFEADWNAPGMEGYDAL